MFLMKSKREKRGQREIQGTQNSGNPNEKINSGFLYFPKVLSFVKKYETR